MKEYRFALYLVWVVIGAYTLFMGVRLYSRMGGDFAASQLVRNLPYNSDYELDRKTSDSHQLLDTILCQPLTYLGKGSQAYAFASADGEYVLKLFKSRHFKVDPWVKNLSVIPGLRGYYEYKCLQKKQILDRVLSGYHLAFCEHRQESGLVYIHLNPADDTQKFVTLFDKMGRKHVFNLDRYFFVIQKRGVTNRTLLDEALRVHDYDLAKRLVDQVFEFYYNEYRKGIYDQDHGVMANVGFRDGRPFRLDVGKLTSDIAIRDKDRMIEDLTVVGLRYEVWLRKKHPEAYGELIPYIEGKFVEFFGKSPKLSKA